MKGSKEARRKQNQQYRARKAKAKQIAKDAANHQIKTHFDTVEDAQTEAIRVQDPNDLHPMVAYVCPICGLYLIGHKRYLSIEK